MAIRWRGSDQMGERFGDLAEVQTATGTSGAFSFGAAAGTGEYVSVEPIGSSSSWGAGGSTATVYVDRGRVWLDGFVSTTGGSTAVGTLPAGKRPAATVYVPVTFNNDLGGTPISTAGWLSVDTAGVVTLGSLPAPTGDLSIFLGGLSFLVAP